MSFKRANISALMFSVLAACTEDIRLPPLSAVDATVADVNDGPSECAAPREVSTCAELPSLLFRHALCTCDDLTLPASIRADAFDSSVAAGGRGLVGGSVATNGRFSATDSVEVAGSLTSAGSEAALLSNGPVLVSGNVQVNSDLIINTADVVLARELWVNGKIVAAASTLRVDGRTLQTPGGSNAGIFLFAGGLERRAPEIATPCVCDPAAWLDAHRIADSVARDQSVPLAPEASLACGRYAAQGGKLGAARWVISGRASVFVDGDMELTGPWEVQVAAGGSLDVFVRGALRLGPLAQVISAQPGLVRIYVQEASDMELAQDARFECSLFAPRSLLSLHGEQTLQGAFVLRAVSTTAALTLHYDAAVLQPQAAACEARACTSDDECEAPALCVSERCSVVH